MLTKTQRKILNLFLSKITKKFTLQGAGKLLGMHQALSYRASQELIKRRLIIKDENGLFHLNYKENRQELVAYEYLRYADFLRKKKHKELQEFFQEFIDKADEDNYIILLFGSAVEKENPRDFDLLFLFEDVDKAQKYENILINLSEYYSLKLDINVDTLDGFDQMLSIRDEKNVINESLNKHILVYGADLYYKRLKKVRIYG